MMIGQKPPQKRQVVLAPFDDLVEVVARPDRAAHHKQQHFRKRMRHPPALPVVVQTSEMIQQNAKTRPSPKVHRCLPMHQDLESDSRPERKPR
jgi:hypothetical protein